MLNTYLRGLVALGSLFSALGVAQAQTTTLKPFPLTGGTQTATDHTNVKISVTYQFFIEGETGTIADQTALADQGRKHLYLMLAKECVVLKETIAETCAIQRASVNAQLLNQTRAKGNGVRISGSASYQIELKKEQGGRP
ncbi:MAG: hypothetical protein KKB37_09295 [Alphaproteobacteria bacterium]|nr:hypothetical protein [Alphaproteobacteria bacterium]